MKEDGARLLWINLKGMSSMKVALRNLFCVAQKTGYWEQSDSNKLVQCNIDLKKVRVKCHVHMLKSKPCQEGMFCTVVGLNAGSVSNGVASEL